MPYHRVGTENRPVEQNILSDRSLPCFEQLLHVAFGDSWDRFFSSVTLSDADSTMSQLWR